MTAAFSEWPSPELARGRFFFSTNSKFSAQVQIHYTENK
jgi:hypothetical protein